MNLFNTNQTRRSLVDLGNSDTLAPLLEIHSLVRIHHCWKSQFPFAICHFVLRIWLKKQADLLLSEEISPLFQDMTKHSFQRISSEKTSKNVSFNQPASADQRGLWYKHDKNRETASQPMVHQLEKGFSWWFC